MEYTDVTDNVPFSIQPGVITVPKLVREIPQGYTTIALLYQSNVHTDRSGSQVIAKHLRKAIHVYFRKKYQ